MAPWHPELNAEYAVPHSQNGGQHAARGAMPRVLACSEPRPVARGTSIQNGEWSPTRRPAAAADCS